MLGIPAHFPDSAVLLAPAARRGIRTGDQEALRVLVNSGQLIREAMRCREQFTVDVDLLLIPRAVAYPNWTAVPPAGEMPQLPLGQIMLAPDPEHDLQAVVRSDA